MPPVGTTLSALYLYGPSAVRMNDLVAEVLAGFPLAQAAEWFRCADAA